MKRMLDQKTIDELSALLENGATQGLSYVNLLKQTLSYDEEDGWVFDEDFVAKTLEQSEANYSADITSFPNIAGGTSSAIFCRVQQLNKSLHVIFVGKITNETEATISAYGTNNVLIELPEKIAEKLYDLDGKNVTENGGDNIISGSPAVALKNKNVDMSTYQNNVIMFIKNSTNINKIAIAFSRNTTLSIAAGETMYFEGRVELDLI